MDNKNSHIVSDGSVAGRCAFLGCTNCPPGGFYREPTDKIGGWLCICQHEQNCHTPLVGNDELVIENNKRIKSLSNADIRLKKRAES